MDGDHYLAAAASEDQGQGAGKGPRPDDTRADQLDYIVDMIGQLKVLARNNGAETLADLLGLSHIEAARAAARSRTTR